MWWNKYIHIPFAEKGRDESGCDCWGHSRLIYQKEKNIELPSYLECYETTEDRDLLAATIQEEKKGWQWFDWKPEKDTAHPFDIIIVNMRGVPMHCGVVTRKGFMIHCAKGINTVHERYDGIRWQNKVLGFARWKNH